MLHIVLFFHILICIIVVGLVLFQKGVNTNIGISFDNSISKDFFGSKGPEFFLKKITGFCFLIFLLTSLFLSYLANNKIHYDQELHIKYFNNSKNIATSKKI